MQDMEVGAEAMAEVDVSGMDFARLSALSEQIGARVREMRETEGPALRERVIEEAKRLTDERLRLAAYWASLRRRSGEEEA